MNTDLQKTPENKGLLAISNALARAKDGMSMQEKKLMAIYLSKVEWKNVLGPSKVEIEGRSIGGCLDCVKSYIGTKYDKIPVKIL